MKAFASALCIGTGGSVGREGPIVQIGSALASTFGQLVRMSETRLRALVGCWAAGGIAATFNAPITGVFFGFELILRVFSIEALFAIFLSAVVATLISREFFGDAAFFSHFPHELAVTQLSNYLLVALLGVLAGLAGFGFKVVLYKVEDLCDAVWGSRPEWLRPVVGGVVLGALLFALPQLYGVGYGVMGDVVGAPDHYAIWFVAVLMLAVAIAAGLSKRLTHGTIYTTKLLRRGTDIERPTPASVLDQFTARDAMQPMPPGPSGHRPPLPDMEQPQPLPTQPDGGTADAGPPWEQLAGPVLRSRRPQALFSDEVLRQALRQLVLYGRDGLPVVSSDSHHLIGWITNADVLAAITTRLDASAGEVEQGELAAEFAAGDAVERLYQPRTPLRGYLIIEITVRAGSVAAGAQVSDLPLSRGYRVVATTHRGKTTAARSDIRLRPGDRITVLMPAAAVSAPPQRNPGGQ